MTRPRRCPCGFAGTPPDERTYCPVCGTDLDALPAWFDAPTNPYVPHVSPPTGVAALPCIPGFDILDELGRGGMGVVYRARQTRLGRDVALKMILSGSHAGPKDRDRFRREAEAVAALSHPNIVQIFEIGEHAGLPFLAFELVPGGTLADRIAGGPPWPARAAAEVIATLADAVEYAHGRGIVHRDLKPGNVLWNGTGALKITDFGLAKRLYGPDATGTGTGAVVGTPSYIAPEQAAGDGPRIGPPTDVYALGAILYELLTGRPPFHADTALETLLQVAKDDPVPPTRTRPSVPKDLENICLKCLAKNPARRYPVAAALADDLRRFATGRSVAARPLSPGGRAVKWAKRHPALAVLGTTSTAAMVAVVAVLGGAYAEVSRAVQEKERQAAVAERGRQEAERERQKATTEKHRADELARKFEQLADENAARREAAEGQAFTLGEQADRFQRGIYALQLSKVAALCEREPARALSLLMNLEQCPERLREFTWHYLRRLCDRQETAFGGHADAVAAVAVSPDSALVATAARAGDPVVRVWDLRTGQAWAELEGHTLGVTGVAFSPDGSRVAAVGDDGSLRVWDLPMAFLTTARQAAAGLPFRLPATRPLTLAPAATVEAHPGPVKAVAFAPGGGRVATGGADHAVKLWTVAAVTHPAAAVAGGVVTRPGVAVEFDRTLAGHSGTVNCLAFAPDGKSLASGADDRTVRVWNLDKPGVRKLPTHAAPVTAVAFSPDGGLLATADNGDTPVVRLWDAKSLHARGRLNGHTKGIMAVAFSPDGSLLASGGRDRTVRLWNPLTGEDGGTLAGHDGPVTGVAFALDRRTLVSSSADRTARVWLARPAGADGVNLNPEPASPVTAAAASADGKLLVTGDAAGRTRVWLPDAAPGRRLPPGTATGGLFPMTLFLANAVPIGPVAAVAVSPDGRFVAAGGDRGLLVYDLRNPTRGVTGQPTFAPLIRDADGRRAIRDAAFSPDGRYLATAEDDGVRVWDVAAGKLLSPGPLAATDGARRVTFIPGPKPLVAAAVGPSVVVSDLSGGVIADLSHRSDANATALAVTADGTRLAAGDGAGGVCVWDVPADRGPGFAVLSESKRHAEPVTTLAFTADARTLISGSRDRTAVLGDPITGQDRATLTGHTDPLVMAAVSPADASVITVGRDGVVRRWRADAKKG